LSNNNEAAAPFGPANHKMAKAHFLAEAWPEH
jgi:hypothetical protein